MPAPAAAAKSGEVELGRLPCRVLLGARPHRVLARAGARAAALLSLPRRSLGAGGLRHVPLGSGSPRLGHCFPPWTAADARELVRDSRDTPAGEAAQGGFVASRTSGAGALGRDETRLLPVQRGVGSEGPREPGAP